MCTHRMVSWYERNSTQSYFIISFSFSFSNKLPSRSSKGFWTPFLALHASLGQHHQFRFLQYKKLKLIMRWPSRVELRQLSICPLNYHNCPLNTTNYPSSRSSNMPWTPCGRDSRLSRPDAPIHFVTYSF